MTRLSSVVLRNTPEVLDVRRQPAYQFGFDPALAQSSPQQVAYDTLRSVNYVSGSAGWRIDGNGNAEFNNVTVRGTFQTGNSGQRVVITTSGPDQLIQIFTGTATETNPGTIVGQKNPLLGAPRLAINSPTISGGSVGSIHLMGNFAAAPNSDGVQIVTANLVLQGTNMGFFGSFGTTQQTVTGSKGANAALASLMTALAAYGLVVDSTT